MTRLARLSAAALIGGCVFAAVGCGANDKILQSGKEPPTPAKAENPKSSFDEDLEAMRTARFGYIFVVRRKDGAVLNADDKKVIKENTNDANRRISSEDGRSIIVGSNYQISATNMAALYDRFAIDNFSTAPPAAPNDNINAANAKKNANGRANK